jgi:hypothetical protein
MHRLSRSSRVFEQYTLAELARRRPLLGFYSRITLAKLTIYTLGMDILQLHRNNNRLKDLRVRYNSSLDLGSHYM